MRNIVFALLLTGSSYVCVVGNAIAANSQAATRSCFKIYDATLFKSRPSLQPQGIERVSVFDITRALKPSQARDEVPDEESIRVWLSGQSPLSNLIVLDVEHWPLIGDPSVVEQSLEKYRNLLSRTRLALGGHLIGYYAVPPIRDYWRAVDVDDSPRYKSWQAENDKWQRLADDVDAIFPSLYTFYEQEDGWVRYAKANIREAKRMAGGKPVYPFIWPQYHESNKKVGQTMIPGAFWRTQLDTIAQQADGVVIWGGYKLNWDAEAPWWLATKQFANDIKCRTPNAPISVRAESGDG